VNTIDKVQFAFRIVIDAETTSIWEKYVFEATYKEYYLQEQLFQDEIDKVETFIELKRKNEKVVQLNHLVGIAAIPYIEQLNGNLYQIKDKLNKTHLQFVNFELDIVNSSSTDYLKYKIGITFFTKQYPYFGEVNNSYLIALEDDFNGNIKTLMIPNRENFSICSIELKKNEN
jgi:hypothetical protein